MRFACLAMAMALFACNAGTSLGSGVDGSSPIANAPAGYSAHALTRRLNITEYNNSVRDLLGVGIDLTGVLPPDASVNGFDNPISSPIDGTTIQAFMNAAQLVAQSALDPSNAASSPWVACNPTSDAQVQACAKQLMVPFVSRAYRRTATDVDMQGILPYFTTASTFSASLSNAIQAVLLSPSFLFRVEAGDGTSLYLTDIEMASRLSYFLWASTPDTALMQAAANGNLHTPQQIGEQARRMLADARAQNFVQSFAGQWLAVRTLDKVKPSPTLFPAYTSELSSAMAQESYAFFADVLQENLPVTTLLKSNFTYVNSVLAQYYGIPGITSSTMQKVTTGDTRGGILMQAVTLSVTSTPLRSSIVKRGEWVLLKLLCQGMPPPPPGVAALSATDPNQTQRQMITAHASQPQCASCHTVLDPIGFGLESYNALGALRTTDDNGAAIDASGVFPDGTTFTGALQMAQHLQQNPAFTRCLENQLMTFALGWAPSTTAEVGALQTLGTSTAAGGSKLADIIVAITQSDLFRQIRLTQG